MKSIVYGETNKPAKQNRVGNCLQHVNSKRYYLSSFIHFLHLLNV